MRKDTPPLPDDDIDSNERSNCLRDHISHGEMIMCYNDLRPIGWFHFSRFFEYRASYRPKVRNAKLNS